MKQSRVSGARRARRTDAARRAQLLAAFDRSGLSGVDFAREQGLHYTTFCAWRQRRDRAKASADFVQVALDSPALSSELVIEVGAGRVRLVSADQIPLAAQLLRACNLARPC